MCLLALFFGAFEDAPLVVAANREEAYTRLGTVPRILAGKLAAVGGVDPVAGGSWLGINERGLLVAVTNRAKAVTPAEPLSRGLLVRELLEQPDASVGAELARARLASGKYAGCNLLLADDRQAYVVAGGDRPGIESLSPGLHLLAAGDVDDPGDRRLVYAQRWLSDRAARDVPGCIEALKELCGQRGDPPMCIRGATSGTVSSSIVAVRPPLSLIYLHAQGPPDRTPYKDYSYLAAEIGLRPSQATG